MMLLMRYKTNTCGPQAGTINGDENRPKSYDVVIRGAWNRHLNRDIFGDQN